MVQRVATYRCAMTSDGWDDRKVLRAQQRRLAGALDQEYSGLWGVDDIVYTVILNNLITFSRGSRARSCGSTRDDDLTRVTSHVSSCSRHNRISPPLCVLTLTTRDRAPRLPFRTHKNQRRHCPPRGGRSTTRTRCHRKVRCADGCETDPRTPIATPHADVPALASAQDAKRGSPGSVGHALYPSPVQ